MGKYRIKPEEKKEVEKATFNEKSDFQAIKLKSGKVCLVHNIQAKKLIEKGLADEAKKAEVIVSREAQIRTKVVVDKKTK